MRSPVGACERARLARRTRDLGPDHPVTVDARNAYRAVRLESAIRGLVDEAPPLDAARRARIARILEPLTRPPTTEPERPEVAA